MKNELMEIMGAHERIGLQVSGGRDSLACWYQLKEAGLLDLVTVYWVNTGAAFPETLEIMAQVREMSPSFVEIAGNQPEVIATFGMPTDILPRSCTPIGLMCGQAEIRMQDSYSCCGRVIMGPMHERMLADGVTLIIRGQRADDSHKAPVQSGDWELGIQYLFPIEQWSDEDVDGYLVKVGAPRNRCYDYVKSQPDCMNCSGWWSDNRAPFLKACYPDAHDEYQRRLDIIRDNTSLLIAQFNIECGGE